MRTLATAPLAATLCAASTALARIAEIAIERVDRAAAQLVKARLVLQQDAERHAVAARSAETRALFEGVP